MNERIRELLSQAGVHYEVMPKDTVYEKFAELIRADEREACAKWLRDNYQDYENIADVCEAIRARMTV